MTPGEQLRNEIANLKDALVAGNPGMPTMLRTIHTKLKEDPANVTLLSEEEIGVIVAGLQKQTNTVIATKAVKSGSRGKKVVSLDDL